MTAPHSLRRLLRAAAVVLATGAMVGTGAPALAAGTHLCDGYRECYDRGMTASGYAAVNDRSFWRMYPGHNCTNYAAYRMIQSGLPNARPWSGGGDATYWGRYMSRWTNSTPRVGAIAWWRDGGPGHVAYVERVVSSSEIIISQDSWRGDFSWARVTKAYRWPDGFIHFNDRQIGNRSAPQLSGLAKVGNAVKASTGSWSPSPSSVSYTWRVGGEVLPGARKSRLNLTSRMIGKQVQVTVTARRYGYPDRSVSSSRTSPVLPGAISALRLPDLSGTAQVNRTMHVTGGSWTPKPVRVDFQWAVDGQPVRGADDKSFALAPRHAGHRISVAVTAKRTGYQPVTKTFTTSAVNRALLTPVRRTSASGRGLRGEVLRVHPGAVKQRATRFIRWMRDGQPIADATGLTYRLTRADVGRQVSARVTFARSGYRPVVQQTGARYVKGKVRLQTTKTRLRNGGVRFDLLATVGGRRLEGPARVVVRNGGRVRATGVLRDGELRLRVTGMPRGHRTLWFYIAPTDQSVNKIVARKAYFR